MRERILALMKERQLSAGRFAELLDVQPSSISHLISGRNNPNYDFIVKLLERFPEVNPDWFLLGKGEMYRAEKEVVSDARVPEQQENLFSPRIETSLKFVDDEDLMLKPKAADADTNKTVEQIIILYSDKTFSVFKE